MSTTPRTDAALKRADETDNWEDAARVLADISAECERALTTERAAHEATKAEASGQIEHLDHENNRLRVELAACRANDRRYRYYEDKVDAAIDAALAKEPSDAD